MWSEGEITFLILSLEGDCMFVFTYVLQNDEFTEMWASKS